MSVRYYDAHNHFQDRRLDPWRDSLASDLLHQPVAQMVVNGTREDDWPIVAELADRYPWIIPSFGYHPWYLDRATAGWRTKLEHYLSTFPFAVGEIGIDRWMKDPDIPLQERMFLEQIEIASTRNLPASIHCIKAWGRLHELLSSVPVPPRGFLLHSYGGPPDLIESFARLGAYFSCPGYFLDERKRAKLDTFKQVPPDRLLLETDAPDQVLPQQLDRFRLADTEGRRANHPANIAAVYEGVAAHLGMKLSLLSSQVERNFRTLFGPR